MTLDLRHLRHLLALVEHGSFGRAAAALNMTQPALSRSVKGLELQIGAELFVRSAAGVTPTDEGRLLVQRARDLVHAADDLDREVARRRVRGADQIVVGAGPYPAETICPDALARFVATHPLVRVRVLVRDWDDLLRRLRAREIELFVAETSTLEGEHDVRVEPFAPHRGYFVARRGHPLARRATVRARHVFEYPFVAMSRYPPRALRPMLAARGEQGAHAGRPFPQVELSSLAAVKRMTMTSDAIAPLTLACVADELERGTLVVLGSEEWIVLGYGVVTLKGHVPSIAATRFLEALREAEAALLGEESRLAARHLADGGARTR
jgi:DNA-binding transcriptional LysR family regulator